MGGTYASLALILAASAAAGQGLFALGGRREWSWLSPAVGLSVLIAVAWGVLKILTRPSVVARFGRRFRHGLAKMPK